MYTFTGDSVDTYYLSLLCFVVLVLVASVRRYLAGRVIRKIQGPPSPSFLVGHFKQLLHQSNVGDLENRWFLKYGTAWRMKGCLGQDQIMIADPKALQYIFNKSGYLVSRGEIQSQLTREIAGEGILASSGNDHARMRKILNPAFSAGQLRSFLPLFRRHAQKLGRKWTEIIEANPKEGESMNVHNWIARSALDIIGEAAFDIDCGAFDNSLNPVMQAYKNMFAKSMIYPSRSTLVFRSFWPYLPHRILRLVKYIPTKDHTHFRRSLNTIEAYSRMIVDEKLETGILQEKGKNKRDILSILLRANASEDPKQQLSDTEMVSMMATFLLAGHDTSSNAMSWFLWELARHPEHQVKLREEIRAARARITARGDTDFDMSDLENMQYVLATMKEVLRLHPIVYMITRVMTRDEILPLAHSVTTVDGDMVNEIAVPSGTNMLVSIWQYNRLPQVWGPDANEFNPERFLNQEKMGDTYVGVTSNLMTFGAGPQSCIGWKFSMIEMQVVLVELIEHFSFAIPEDKPSILRFPVGVITPIVKENMGAGVQMPLRVSVV